MTLTLLDLYNSTASQEWAMYDNDAQNEDEFEQSLVLAINKSIFQIYMSYEFPFRERTHLILTIPRLNCYDMPNGLIKTNKEGKAEIRYNTSYLKQRDEKECLCQNLGIPNSYFIKNDKLILYPTPADKYFLVVDYYTLSIGESEDGEELYSLKKATDKLNVPVHLEELMKEAIITRTMLNTIASESDENYSAYKKQADSAYKMLVKYSKGVWQEKSIKLN